VKGITLKKWKLKGRMDERLIKAEESRMSFWLTAENENQLP